MANKEHEKEPVKEPEHKAKKEPVLHTDDQVLRLVTETIHEMNPQPDPATIKDILAALQAKLHAASGAS